MGLGEEKKKRVKGLTCVLLWMQSFDSLQTHERHLEVLAAMTTTMTGVDHHALEKEGLLHLLGYPTIRAH